MNDHEAKEGEHIPFDLTPPNNIHIFKTGEVLKGEYTVVERALPPPPPLPRLPAPQPDLIRADELAAKKSAENAAWMAQGESPEYYAALGEKPWEKPAANSRRSNNDQEMER